MEEQKHYLTTADQAAALATVTESLFFNVEVFEHAQRVAKMLASSSMVPRHFQGEKNIGNVLIAMNYAHRIRADIFMVMQSMYIVHGRPGIEGKLVIALINQCGRFEPLEFDSDDTGTTAVAVQKSTGQVLRGPKISREMVAAEGWNKDSKTEDGRVIRSKWNTMPELMYRYRAAAFFARTYCPEVLLGMQTREELEDTIVDLTRSAGGEYLRAESTPQETKTKTERVRDKLKKKSAPPEMPTPPQEDPEPAFAPAPIETATPTGELSPGECPNLRQGEYAFAEYCNTRCKEREGCPAWENAGK